MIDWTGAQIGNNDTADDIKNVDLTQIHYLSGPVAVSGAEPGDCLVVDILDGSFFLLLRVRARVASVFRVRHYNRRKGIDIHRGILIRNGYSSKTRLP